MKMLRTNAILLLTSLAFFSLSSFVQPIVVPAPVMAVVDAPRTAAEWNTPKTLNAPKTVTANFGLQTITQADFLALTPEKYRQITGKKLGFVKSMELKWAQKKLRNAKPDEAGASIPKWLYILMSIFALGWLALGIITGFKGNDWWIALLLYFAFVIPGIIYSLIVMKKYY
jgi:uncharacterized membrane protein YqaE (UPF0057 family)